MNLDELIQELCPDGTEFRKLIEVSDILYGYPCDASKFNEDMNGMPLVRIRDVLAGETSTFTTELVPDDYIVHAGDLLVGMDGNFHVSAWKMGDAILCQRVCKVSSKDENVVKSSFLKHLLPPIIKSIEQGKQSGTVKHLLAKDINAIRIPLPPLPVQQEIVRILDSFTQLTAELTAELTARRKQYEHYRDELLTFGDEVAIVSLGDIAEVSVGSKPTEMFDIRTEYEYINAGTTNSGYTSVPNCEGDTVTTPSRGQGGIGFVGYQSTPFWLGPLCYKIKAKKKPSFLNKFLFYYIQSRNCEILKMKKEGGVPAVNRADLVKMSIPHVPIETQQYIVNILDRFDTLCNDLTSGLPAEIEARQKQYEYYRDKLLNFKELKA